MGIDWETEGNQDLWEVVRAIAAKLIALLVDTIKARWLPSEVEQALMAAIESAQIQDGKLPLEYHLFAYCTELQMQTLLQQVLEHPACLVELRKPLQQEGLPDGAAVVMAFQQVTHELNIPLVEARIQPWVVEFIETYFRETSAAIQLQMVKQQYLSALAQHVGDITFVGIAMDTEGWDNQDQLAKLFVMPTVREETRSLNPGSGVEDWSSLAIKAVASQQQLLDEQRAWVMRDRSGRQLPAYKILSQTKNKAVILGAPGSGKTTLLHYFALMLTNHPQSDPSQIGFNPGENWLPIIVRVRDWALRPDLGLLAYLNWYATDSLRLSNLPADFFQHWLEWGRALLLIDGLDEVVDESHRRTIVQQIELFLYHYGTNPMVITSRPAGYRWDFFTLDAFPHYTLESFDDRQIATFIERWYTNRLSDPRQVEACKADLCQALTLNQAINQLAQNPLLLLLIAMIHRYQAELPRQRYKLYERAVDTLLHNWDSGSNIRLYGQVLYYLKPDDLLYVLQKLAYWIHSQGAVGDRDGGTLIWETELIRQLSNDIAVLKGCQPHEAQPEAERFVEFIQWRIGLLNQQGHGRYAFMHKTFQEYLAAEEIYTRFDEGEDEIIHHHLKLYLHQQHWREVLLLLVSMLKKKRATEAIWEILLAGTDYEHWLHRDLLFAGWCLTEDPQCVQRADGELVQRILDGLVELEAANRDQVSYRIKDEVARILHGLGKTSLAAIAWERVQTQAAKIDQFRLLKYQISLGQAEAAIQQLLVLLNDKSSTVRSRAAVALGNLGYVSPDIVNGLMARLTDDQINVRTQAEAALGKLSLTSPEVIDGLLHRLTDPYVDVRRSAVNALGKLSQPSLEVINGLFARLTDEAPEVRRSAATALGNLKYASPDVVSGLLARLNDRHPDVRRSAANALGNLGYASMEVVNALLACLSDADSSVRFIAVFALGKLGHNATEVVNGLLSRLIEANSSVRFMRYLRMGIWVPPPRKR